MKVNDFLNGLEKLMKNGQLPESFELVELVSRMYRGIHHFRLAYGYDESLKTENVIKWDKYGHAYRSVGTFQKYEDIAWNEEEGRPMRVFPFDMIYSPKYDIKVTKDKAL